MYFGASVMLGPLSGAPKALTKRTAASGRGWTWFLVLGLISHLFDACLMSQQNFVFNAHIQCAKRKYSNID